MTTRILRALIRAYPPAFRRRFGDDVVESLSRDRAAAARRGPRALAVFWVMAVVQAVWFGAIERRAASKARAQAPGGAPRRRFSMAVDLRDARRALFATPVVTVVATLSLALGIGANLALFAIANGLILKPLPVRDPERLVLLESGSWTNPIWEQLRDRHADLFDGAFAWSNERFDLALSGTKDQVEGAYASGGMFDVLGVQARLGRTFSARDDVRGGGPNGPVAVISHALWQRRFAGDPDIIGRRLSIERVPFTIVGVTPAGFFGAEVGRAWDVILPLGTEAIVRGRGSSLDGRSVWWLQIMARLRAGTTVDQTAAALDAVRPQIREATHPSGDAHSGYLTDRFTLLPASSGRSTLRNRYSQPLAIIMAVVAAVLLIACANIANLLLARAAARRHELGVRLALGASRWRIARQLAAETVMLASAGTALGVVLAVPGSAALMRQLGAPGQAPVVDLTPDWRVAAFTIGLTVATALLFGIAPALGVSQVAPGEALKEQARGVAGDRRVNLRNALVVVQVALSLVLIVGAGLFLRTFVSLVRTPLGFDPAPLTVVTVDLQRSQSSASSRSAIYERLREEAAAIPGITSVGLSVITPVSGSGWNAPIHVEGSPAPPAPADPAQARDARRRTMSWVNAVSPDWLSTYGIRVVAGRHFAGTDRAGAPLVAIVNEAFVERFFGGQNPVGRSVTAGQIAGPGMSSFEIIGVVPNAIYRSARAGTSPTMYVPLEQTGESPSSLAFTLRSAIPDAPFRKAVDETMRNVEPAAAFTFRRMNDIVRTSIAQERLLALLSACFGGIAVLLAALGLYGVTCYSVSRRRSEIGIRMALGADRGMIARLVMRRVGALLAAGIVGGVTASAWAATFVSSLLFGLDARDISTFAAAAAALLAVGALAGWLPARRAARTDPMHVLRDP